MQVFGNVDKTNKILNQARGSTTECYTVLFDKDDADFEIKIDNFLRSNFICPIEVGSYSSSSSFFIRTGDTLWLKTLKSEGKHLHFTSQNTEQGQLLILMQASTYGISYNEAAVKCSRIEFDIEVEKMNGLKSSERTSKMTVSVRILAGRTINVEVCPADTVQTLKFISQTIGRIRADQQLLTFAGKAMLDDCKTLSDYIVTNGSTVHLSLRLLGGHIMTSTPRVA